MAKEPLYQRVYPGARRATPAELSAAGMKPSSRGYVLPSGQVVSNRELQTQISGYVYGKPGERISLESRRDIRYAETGVRNPLTTRAHFADALSKHPPNSGLMRWGDLKGKSRKEIYNDPRFKEMWEDWQVTRTKKGDARIRFLRRHRLLTREGNHWDT